MAKSRVVILEIKNETGKTMSYQDDWFDSGRVADHSSFPKQINSGDSATVQCYEKDWSIGTGCSGYVTYLAGNSPITIAFSNPSVGSNKLGVGLDGKKVWDDMSSHNYETFNGEFQLQDTTIISYSGKCTGGETNTADLLLYAKELKYVNASDCSHSNIKSLKEKDINMKQDLPSYPVGWLPYLADWKNYIVSGKFPFKYYDPSDIPNVGVLVYQQYGVLYGDDLQKKQCVEVTQYPKKEGHYSWVLTADGSILYVWNPDLQIQEKNYTRHSDLNKGKPVTCAGEFYLSSGSLNKLYIELNDSSGHYKPNGTICFSFVLMKFEELGIDISNVEVFTRN